MSTCSKRLSGVIAAISITALTAATFMGIKSTPANAISLDTTSAALNYANNFDGFYSVPAHYPTAVSYTHLTLPTNREV